MACGRAHASWSKTILDANVTAWLPIHTCHRACSLSSTLPALLLVCVPCVPLQFGSSSQAVFFKMRVAGVLHIFQFETRQGEDICMALQTHINDIMMKRYSKVGRPLGRALCAVQHRY